MAEAELHLEELTISGLLATAAGIASALENNPNFPSPVPASAVLDQSAAELADLEQAYQAARTAASDARRMRDEKARALREALTQEVAYVQEASGGEVAKILSASLHVEETTSFWPFGSLGDIEDVTASVGDLPGEIDLAWDAVAGASGYEIERATDLLGEHWEESGATSQSKLTIEQLSPRARYWFRVRAIGPRGACGWSKPVMKFAR